MGGLASCSEKSLSIMDSRRSVLTPMSITGCSLGRAGPAPIWPYGRGFQPASTVAPGTSRAARAERYSHRALMFVRSWPVLCTATVAGTEIARVSAAPCRKPPAVGLGGSPATETSLYLAR